MAGLSNVNVENTKFAMLSSKISLNFKISNFLYKGSEEGSGPGSWP